MRRSSNVDRFPCSFSEMTDYRHDRQRIEFHEMGYTRVHASLPLQIVLYINMWVLPIWFLVTGINFNAKQYYRLTDVYKLLIGAVFFLAFVIEILRLYLGYLGNLAGKIPELAGFWFLSTLIQLPLEAFLLIGSGMFVHIGEISINCLVVLLLVIEIVMGTVVLRNFADARAQRFYLAQVYGRKDESSRR